MTKTIFYWKSVRRLEIQRKARTAGMFPNALFVGFLLGHDGLAFRAHGGELESLRNAAGPASPAIETSTCGVAYELGERSLPQPSIVVRDDQAFLGVLYSPACPPPTVEFSEDLRIWHSGPILLGGEAPPPAPPVDWVEQMSSASGARLRILPLAPTPTNARFFRSRMESSADAGSTRTRSASD